MQKTPEQRRGDRSVEREAPAALDVVFRSVPVSEEALERVRRSCDAAGRVLRDVRAFRVLIQKSPKSPTLWVTLEAWSARGRRSTGACGERLEAAIERAFDHLLADDASPHGLPDAPDTWRAV